jgi:hypothetical protein
MVSPCVTVDKVRGILCQKHKLLLRQIFEGLPPGYTVLSVYR